MRLATKKYLLRCVVLILVMSLAPMPAMAIPDSAPKSGKQAFSGSPEPAQHRARAVCNIIVREANRWSLPHSFFMRLIWQESRFNSAAVSPAGAQGIAQFMPATAKERGLEDPYSPAEALGASAHLLSDLRANLGNLGLAAAAYNAGANAVRSWLGGKRNLPRETRDYVVKITGTPAESWADAKDEYPTEANRDATQACLELASSEPKPRRLASLQPQRSSVPEEPARASTDATRAKQKSSVRKASSESFCTAFAAIGAACRSVRR